MVTQRSKVHVSPLTQPQSIIGGLAADFLEDATPTNVATEPQATVDTKVVRIDIPSPANDPTGDDELLSRTTSAISGIPAFRLVRIEVTSGAVTVRGKVDSAFEKQLLFRRLTRVTGAKRWIDVVSVAAPRVEREGILSRLIRATTETLEPHLPKHSLRWGVMLSTAAILLVFAPWTSRGHSIATVPVSMRVLYDGQLAIGAFVTLHPIGENPLPNDVRPSGYVQPNGQARFATFDRNDGVPAGEYLVSVRWNKLVMNGEESTTGPNILPERYLLPMTSGLRIKVKPGQTELPPLDLKR